MTTQRKNPNFLAELQGKLAQDKNGLKNIAAASPSVASVPISAAPPRPARPSDIAIAQRNIPKTEAKTSSQPIQQQSKILEVIASLLHDRLHHIALILNGEENKLLKRLREENELLEKLRNAFISKEENHSYIVEKNEEGLTVLHQVMRGFMKKSARLDLVKELLKLANTSPFSLSQQEVHGNDLVAFVLSERLYDCLPLLEEFYPNDFDTRVLKYLAENNDPIVFNDLIARGFVKSKKQLVKLVELAEKHLSEFLDDANRENLLQRLVHIQALCQRQLQIHINAIQALKNHGLMEHIYPLVSAKHKIQNWLIVCRTYINFISPSQQEAQITIPKPPHRLNLRPFSRSFSPNLTESLQYILENNSHQGISSLIQKKRKLISNPTHDNLVLKEEHKEQALPQPEPSTEEKEASAERARAFIAKIDADPTLIIKRYRNGLLSLQRAILMGEDKLEQTYLIKELLKRACMPPYSLDMQTTQDGKNLETFVQEAELSSELRDKILQWIKKAREFEKAQKPAEPAVEVERPQAQPAAERNAPTPPASASIEPSSTVKKRQEPAPLSADKEKEKEPTRSASDEKKESKRTPASQPSTHSSFITAKAANTPRMQQDAENKSQQKSKASIKPLNTLPPSKPISSSYEFFVMFLTQIKAEINGISLDNKYEPSRKLIQSQIDSNLAILNAASQIDPKTRKLFAPPAIIQKALGIVADNMVEHLNAFLVAIDKENTVKIGKFFQTKNLPWTYETDKIVLKR